MRARRGSRQNSGLKDSDVTKALLQLLDHTGHEGTTVEEFEPARGCDHNGS